MEFQDEEGFDDAVTQGLGRSLGDQGVEGGLGRGLEGWWRGGE